MQIDDLLIDKSSMNPLTIASDNVIYQLTVYDV